MNSWLFYIILLFLNLRSLTNVSERNTLKMNAFNAFQKRDFKKATVLYQRLADATYIVEPEVRLNLAHAYFSIRDTLNAKIQYKRILQLHNDIYGATALTQLGVILTENGDSTTALNLFKIALQKNPNSEITRFNYELLRKKLPKQKLPPPPKQNQEEKKKQDENPETAKTLEQTEEKKQDLKTSPPENISREKALQILDAMKNNEIQYIQQKKKSNSGKKIEKDW